MDIERIDIGLIKENKDNPRKIRKEKLLKLIKSIKDFPEMLEARPIVVDEDLVVLGGNMRLKACQRAGLKEVPILRFKDLDEARKREFIIKDNVGFGDWDWDILNSEDMWNLNDLEAWGMDIKAAKPDEEEGEVGFNQGIDFESNYIVLKFRTDIDWLQALSLFDLEVGWNKGANGKGYTKGLGRVVDGPTAIEKIRSGL
jgi:hypothetical protein